MRQKNRDSQSLILKLLSPTMNMDMDCPFQEAEKREEGRSIPAAPLFLL